MSSAEKQIRERVEAFVKDLESLIRQAAVEAVAQALGVGTASVHAQLASGSGGRKQPGEGRAAAKRAIAAARPEVTPKSKAKGAGESGKRTRRSAAEIEALGNAIVAYVSKNPGQRAEQIKQALGLDAADWTLPVKKLVDEGQLHTVGEKRATTYSTRARLGEG